MPPSSTDDWFEVLKILDQKGRNKFKVSWVGIDPSTAEPWPSTWVYLPLYETHFGRSGERTAHQLFSMPGKRNRLVGKKRIPLFLFKVNYRCFGLVRILFLFYAYDSYS
jgi:hypothetical protein